MISSGGQILENAALTQGQVIFPNASGLPAGASTFFWNSTNNNLGIGNNTPNASAIVDLTNTTSKGLGMPSVALTATNTASPVTSPATGLMVYNTANTTTTAASQDIAVVPGIYTYDGTQWVRNGGNKHVVPIQLGGGPIAAGNYYWLNGYSTYASNGTVTADANGISPNTSWIIYTATSRCKLNSINLQTMSTTAGKSVEFECEKYTVASGSTTYPTGIAVIANTNVSLATALGYYRNVITGNTSAVLNPGDQLIFSLKNTSGSTYTIYVAGSIEFEDY